MPTPRKTRAYDAPARRAAAEDTRARILQAARELFTAGGYAQTVVSAIADRARVSLDTVYAAVGPKPRLLLAVIDMALADAPTPVLAEERDYVRDIRAAPTAAEKIQTYAAALGRRMPIVAPLLLALRDAGLSDPDCRAAWEQVTERRAANMLLFAADLRATGGLREDLSDQQVADLVWATNSPEFFALLAARGHTADSYARTLADLWTRNLLVRAGSA